MAQEWNIRPRGHDCTLCQTPLRDKEPCISVLRDDAAQGYLRLDCHPECWQRMARSWEPFSLWEGEYTLPPPPAAREAALKPESAEELLRRLVILDDPAMRNATYILAVMLERGKQLIERATRRDERGRLLRIYEDRPSGDTFIIIDPQLRLEQLGEVQQQVVALLSGTDTLAQEGDLSAPAEASAPVEESAPAKELRSES